MKFTRCVNMQSKSVQSEDETNVSLSQLAHDERIRSNAESLQTPVGCLPISLPFNVAFFLLSLHFKLCYTQHVNPQLHQGV